MAVEEVCKLLYLHNHMVQVSRSLRTYYKCCTENIHKLVCIILLLSFRIAALSLMRSVVAP